MNKETVDRVIEALGGKRIILPLGMGATSKMKHISIGTVLAKIYCKMGILTKVAGYGCDADLPLRRWQACGKLFTDEQALDKSLQQIIEASGWETNACFPGKHGVAGAVCGGLHPNCQAVEVLKSPEASRLFKFLADILNLN